VLPRGAPVLRRDRGGPRLDGPATHRPLAPDALAATFRKALAMLDAAGPRAATDHATQLTNLGRGACTIQKQDAEAAHRAREGLTPSWPRRRSSRKSASRCGARARRRGVPAAASAAGRDRAPRSPRASARRAGRGSVRRTRKCAATRHDRLVEWKGLPVKTLTLHERRGVGRARHARTTCISRSPRAKPLRRARAGALDRDRSHRDRARHGCAGRAGARGRTLKVDVPDPWMSSKHVVFRARARALGRRRRGARATASSSTR